MANLFSLRVDDGDDGDFIFWTHWGRVGEPGRTALHDGLTQDKAVRSFCRKFREKTGNSWEDRGEPVQSDKYDVVELDEVRRAPC